MKTPRPRLSWLVLLSALTVPGAHPACADLVSLVSDIGQRVPVHQGPFPLVGLMPWVGQLGDALYLLHDDGIHGRELWRTDGTAGGTRLVRDLCPGACGTGHWGSFADLAVVGGTLYFVADDGTHGHELWRSDGTAAGTVLVRDVRPGIESSLPSLLVGAGGALFFWADDGVHGAELWRSDGTPGGTLLVREVVPGPEGAWARSAGAVGDRLVFGFGSTRPELWASDGTFEGTQQIAALSTLLQSPFRADPWLTMPNGLLLFSAETPGDGWRLWRTDGTTAGTQPVALTMTLTSAPSDFVLVGDQLFFTAWVEGQPARSLLRTDGTAEGTAIVALPPGVNPYGIRLVAPLGNQLVFFAWDEAHGAEPWVTDGLTATMLGDLWPGPDSSASLLILFGYGLFATVGDRVVFTADDGAHGAEIWTTDGSPAGTSLLAELVPGAQGVALDGYQALVPPVLLDGQLLFRDATADFGRRLWSTDGTSAGTSLVEVVADQTSITHPSAPGLFFYAPPPPRCLTAMGGQLLFAADDGLHGSEPWRSDGTEAGTAMLVDLAPGAAYTSSSPRGCQGVGGRGVVDAEFGDPQASGLLALEPAGGVFEVLGGGGSSFGPAWAQLDGEQYLAGGAGVLGRTDATAAGTSAVGQLDGGCGLPELTVMGDHLFGTSSCGLAASDGQTTAVIAPEGESFTAVSNLRALGSTVFFAASHPNSDAEIWMTDGTTEGTTPLADPLPGPERGIERLLELGFESSAAAAAESRYVFVADDGVSGVELWASDGTPEGTAMVKDLALGPYPSWPRDLTAFDGKVFFVAEATGLGRELWVSDGTENGTVLVADIVPGEGSSLPQNLTVADGKLCFSAWDPLHGREAWRVLPAPAPPRGSAAEANVSGTAPPPPSIERLPDIALGTRSSSPLRFASVGGTTYTLANDNVRGFELWKIEEAGLIFRDGFESEDTEHWSGVAP